MGIFEGLILDQGSYDLIEADALDLSMKFHGNTSEKPTSLVDLFARNNRAIPERQEVDHLNPKTLNRLQI